MKKLYNIFYFLLILCFSSCSSVDIEEYGKVEIYNSSVNSKSFIFSVTESYSRKYKKSKPDRNHPKLTSAEANLLDKLLHRKNLCINDYHNAVFEITSKQEKIYDITFAELIQENYNARPIVPKRYYGRCVNKKNPLEPDVRRW